MFVLGSNNGTVEVWIKEFVLYIHTSWMIVWKTRLCTYQIVLSFVLYLICVVAFIVMVSSFVFLYHGL